RSASRAHTVTQAPSRRNARATASPNPWLAPATSACRPESLTPSDLPSGPPIEEPRMLLEVAQGSDDTLTDGQRGVPSQRTDLRAVEEDEGAVADPSPLASRVRPLGRHAEMLRDPSDRIVHLTVLVGPEVEDVDLPARVRDREKHRVEAILDVEVGL